MSSDTTVDDGCNDEELEFEANAAVALLCSKSRK